jgi:hypothetical protein
MLRTADASLGTLWTPLPEDETGSTHLHPPCSRGEGRFYCIEHERYTWDGDAHLRDDDSIHTLLWVCAEHGPEIPNALPEVPGVRNPYGCILHGHELAHLADAHLSTPGPHIVSYEGDTCRGDEG